MLQDKDICSQASIFSIIALHLLCLEGIIALNTQDLGYLVVLPPEATGTLLFTMLVELPEQVLAQNGEETN